MTSHVTEAVDSLLKIMLIGDYTVARDRQALLRRYVDDSPAPSWSSRSLPVDFLIKHVHVGGRHIKLQVWDSLSNDRTRPTRHRHYYRGVQAFVVVYSVTDRASFTGLGWWLKHLQELGEPGSLITLVGTNCEAMTRVVTADEGRAVAQAHNILFFEASAESGVGVSEAFAAVVDQVLTRIEAGDVPTLPVPPSTSGIVNLNEGSGARRESRFGC